jgi:hypothetical protein
MQWRIRVVVVWNVILVDVVARNFSRKRFRLFDGSRVIGFIRLKRESYAAPARSSCPADLRSAATAWAQAR